MPASAPSSHRTIIHIDLDAFFCAVEEQHNPGLRGKAFAVGGSPDGRGVVSSCSYAARVYGVRSAMPMATAIRLCPHLLVVGVRHGEYSAVSKKVMALLRTWTDQLQQISIDEAFLDVTALTKNGVTGRDIALDMQDHVMGELGLSCSVGVASNKLVAKIASDHGKVAAGKKHSPQAICVVEPGKEGEFLAPLPVGTMWGVGPKTGQRLADLGITTLGDLADWPERDLMQRFGKHGYELSQHAKGIDKREISLERESKSISSERTFSVDIDEWETLRDTILKQAEGVSRQLRKDHYQSSTVKLKLRWTDFTTLSRQITLTAPTSDADVIAKTGLELLRQLWKDSRPIRLIGIGCANISAVQQLGLWDGMEEAEVALPQKQQDPILERKRKRIGNAIALLETRFGGSIVRSGSELFSSRVEDEPEQTVEYRRQKHANR